MQGFSEPEAGSDLASLRTSARREGDSYVVNGQKLWASGGMHADWCLLLARTDPDAPKRKGISYFLLDMSTPGVEVRPIRNAIGDSHFCEIFLDDVTIPAVNLVGAENAGWQVAQATLGAERGMTMLELAERLGHAGFRWLVEACPVDDPVVADRLVQFDIEITGLRGLARDVVERTEAGTAGPADASIVKLYYSELLQRMTDFGAEIGGLAAHTQLAKPLSSGWESGAWMLDFIGSWEWTIPGGASEIQRTIIAERGLGLPREPSVGLMAAEFEEFHDELRSVAGDVLSKDRVVEWPALVDAGWVGLEVPEQFGGAGATFAETAVICEEMGRAASANSYLGSAVLAVGTLNALQPSDTRDGLLADVASGAVRVAVAMEPFEFVPDADGADRILVIANGGVAVAAVTVTPQPVLDETRRLAAVSAQDVAEVLRFDGDPDAQVRRLSDRAAVAVACDSLGLSEAMLSATVSYVKVRQQFGRPIGSFQAVKHACADMQVRIAVSRQLVRAAIESVVHGRCDGAASMAKSYACTAAVDIAGKAMQLHGGIGYTWESGIHVYLKRAALNRSLFGSPAAHRRELAKRYL